MSRNIKEIGKELLGKSLNSFHRKTGLTQLEKNNKMQDGILDGILSQVDDAYIEKTEQSNVIHLDGSGDGVVILDGIEGNTMVNLCGRMNSGDTQWILNNGWWELNKEGVLFLDFEVTVKPSTLYTVIMNTKLDNSGGIVFGFRKDNLGWNSDTHSTELNGVNKFKFTTSSEETNRFTLHRGITVGETTTIGVKDIMILEGDWTNKEIPASYFEGLQSSFEEQVEDDKYKIEILMKNKNLIPIEYKRYESYIYHSTYKAIKLDKLNPNETYKLSVKTKNGNLKNGEYICISPTINPNHASSLGLRFFMFVENGIPRSSMNFSPKNNGEYYLSFWHNGGITKETFNNMMNEIEYIQLEKVNSSNKWEQPKQNKIKLLLDEPLRNKDKLCIKDGKIVVERNSKQSLLDGNLNWAVNNSDNEGIYSISTTDLVGVPKGFIISDKLPTTTTTKNEGVMLGITTGKVMVCIDRNKLTNTTLNGMKQYLNENPMQVVFDIETYYEEVLNEYGEPILLEGYENGTLYIDSTIVPTTTVRYTPKMESFKTLKEVNNNNVILTNDINDNIIPYLMNVDLMIMEKEMALPSQINIRKMEVLDMTSMQKRTQDMLERLIKGKTLTEQECKTRVAVYLNAGKITDEQAKELNFLIDEIYA